MKVLLESMESMEVIFKKLKKHFFFKFLMKKRASLPFHFLFFSFFVFFIFLFFFLYFSILFLNNFNMKGAQRGLGNNHVKCRFVTMQFITMIVNRAITPPINDLANGDVRTLPSVLDVSIKNSLFSLFVPVNAKLVIFIRELADLTKISIRQVNLDNLILGLFDHGNELFCVGIHGGLGNEWSRIRIQSHSHFLNK